MSVSHNIVAKFAIAKLVLLGFCRSCRKQIAFTLAEVAVVSFRFMLDRKVPYFLPCSIILTCFFVDKGYVAVYAA